MHMVPGSPSAEVSPSPKWKGCRRVSYILGANDLKYFRWLIHFGNGTSGKSGKLYISIIIYYCVFLGRGIRSQDTGAGCL